MHKLDRGRLPARCRLRDSRQSRTRRCARGARRGRAVHGLRARRRCAGFANRARRSRRAHQLPCAPTALTSSRQPASYEEAVTHAASHASATGAMMLSDTASIETDAVARWIMLGYTRVFAEASRQWPAPPDVVIVQGGVGGLVAAAASWFAFHHGSGRPRLIACEPETHDCLLASARAGHAVDLADLLHSPRSDRGSGAPAACLPPTIMAGLRCSRPSAAAWPAVRDGIDAFVAISDSRRARNDRTRLPTPSNAIQRSRQDLPEPAASAHWSRWLASGNSVPDELGRLDRSTSVMAIVTEGT